MKTSGVIRVAELHDSGAIAEIYAPFVLHSAVSFEINPPTSEEMAQRMRASSDAFPWLVYELDGAVLGYAYASAHRVRTAYRWAADVSIYLAPNARERGIGRGLYGALLEILRALSYEIALAGISLPNDASVGLHEAMGFEPVGVYRSIGYKFGRWHDVGWWQLRLTRGVHRDAVIPAEPTTMKEWRARVGAEWCVMWDIADV